MILQLNQTERDTISIAIYEKLNQVLEAMDKTLQAEVWCCEKYNELEYCANVLQRIADKLEELNDERLYRRT